MVKHFVFFYILYLSSTYLSAENNDTTVGENPFDYFESAFTRIKEFLPNAEFHQVESKGMPKHYFCPSKRWDFTFLDKERREVGEVSVYSRDESLPGGGITCNVAYDVAIYTFSDHLGYDDWYSSPNPQDHMKISFIEAMQSVSQACNPKLIVKSLRISFEFSENLRIFVYGEVNNEWASAEVNMTTGKIEAFCNPLPPEFVLPPIPPSESAPKL